MEKRDRDNSRPIEITGGHLRWYWIPVLMAAMGLASIAYGAMRGEVLIVLKKATLICLECIGLG